MPALRHRPSRVLPSSVTRARRCHRSRVFRVRRWVFRPGLRRLRPPVFPVCRWVFRPALRRLRPRVFRVRRSSATPGPLRPLDFRRLALLSRLQLARPLRAGAYRVRRSLPPAARRRHRRRVFRVRLSSARRVPCLPQVSPRRVLRSPPLPVTRRRRPRVFPVPPSRGSRVW
ncbi:hypothetical protein [Mycolicibacterium chlorophenolicum]|uniref:hypothetical protein n=1 Tax=Mycolicibacterium chlorophenolicum TaxID=37916 RepID=UPI00245727BB|nr:hypothetical protein [Mycolicibacterium chlorophenolicum]